MDGRSSSTPSSSSSRKKSTYPSNFVEEILLTLATYDDTLFIHKDGSKIQLGHKNTYLQIAASATLDAGLYTLQYTKTGDLLNMYTAVPPLTVVVSNQKCELATAQVSYSMPKGGMTLPVRISAISCLPTQNITITPSFSISGQVEMDSDLSSNILTSTSMDG